MGITGLWDEVGSGELISLAQLATDFLQSKGRPLRIAVDEAGWRFNNLNPQQVALIKAKEPAARPIEKAIFHRVVSLLHLSIQLLFVFDGPKRPAKRGRHGGARVDYDVLRETRSLLNHLSIPQHTAPGEAEAECAKLQQDGIVDAVWTDDSDAFMFGTTMLIKTHHEKGGAKSKTHVRVFRADTIRLEHGLDQDGFVLFALLAGGDYDTKGLPGCGPKTALKLAKEGLGRSLRECKDYGIHVWRRQLQSALQGKCEVPFNFPNMRALRYYTNPTVSDPYQVQNLRALRNGWDQPLDEAKLQIFLQTHYNIQIKGYLKHIIPIFLLRTLCGTPEGLAHTNKVYGVELAKTRKRKGEDETVVPLQRKITFLPQAVTSLDLRVQLERPRSEDWSLLTNENRKPFDAMARIDCEILDYALRKGAPHLFQSSSENSKKFAVKRSHNEATAESEASPQCSNRKQRPGSIAMHDSQRLIYGNKRAKTNGVSTIETSTLNKVEESQPPSTFRKPPYLRFTDVDVMAERFTDSYSNISKMPSVNVAMEGNEDGKVPTSPAVPSALMHIYSSAFNQAQLMDDHIQAKQPSHLQCHESASACAGRSIENPIVLE